MKLIRSTRPLVFDSRNGYSESIAVKIQDWTREAKFNRFKAVVEDFIVTDIENPQPGAPLKNYKPINRKEVLYTNAEIDGLFTALNNPILIGESFTEKLDDLLANALLVVTQQKPIYGSTAADWEIVDTSTEIAPIEEPLTE